VQKNNENGNHQMDLWVTEEHRGIVAHRFRVLRTLFSGQSPHQKVDVIQTQDHGRMLLNDGVIMLSERDEFIYHEMIAHVPVFVHPNPRKVLIIGGGDGGTAREVLKHGSIERVVMVEIDELVVSACRDHLPSLSCALDDPRLELIIGDGVAYAAGGSEVFDIAIIDSTDPVGPAAPLFDKEFYGNIAAMIGAGGIMVSQAESPYYDIDIQQVLLGNQRPFFKKLHLYLFSSLTYPGGTWSFAFASNGPCPISDFMPDRIRQSGIDFRYYTPGVHPAAFMLPGEISGNLKNLLDPLPEPEWKAR
jgi:spermidine synthase